jgi:hypothetical protein
VNTLGGATPIGLLTFDCAVRRRNSVRSGVPEFDEIERIFRRALHGASTPTARWLDTVVLPACIT